MVDPSTLFSAEGLEWVVSNRELGVEVFISHWIGEWLDGTQSADPSLFLASDDLEQFESRMAELRANDIVRTLTRFDHREARLAGEAMSVLETLLSKDLPAAEVWADEWAYLQSHSWLTSKLRHPLDAFRDAGAAILEYGREKGLDLIAEVIPAEHIPPSITSEILARAAVKWIVVGGATIGGGTLGGVWGAHLGGPVGGVIAKRALARFGRRLSTAAVLAIDP